MAKHAAEENMVEMEETEMERKRREAEPVVVPTHTNLLPTTYHHLAGAYPVYYNNPYLTYPLHQVQSKSQKQKDLEIKLSNTKGLHSVRPLGDLIYIICI